MHTLQLSKQILQFNFRYKQNSTIGDSPQLYYFEKMIQKGSVPNCTILLLCNACGKVL